MLEFEVLHHVAISVSDLARAKEFYGDVLGLEEIARPAFPFDGAWYRVGNQEVHLIVSRDPTFRTGKGVTLEDGHFALRVEELSRGARAPRVEGLPLRRRRARPLDAREHRQRHGLSADSRARSGSECDRDQCGRSIEVKT